MEKREVFEDYFVTAAEQGSGYWAMFDTDVKGTSEKSASEILFAKIWDNGEEIAIVDVEDPSTKLGTITKQAMINGYDLLLRDYPDITVEDDDDDLVFDAEVADLWLQYVVLKEIVFG